MDKERAPEKNCCAVKAFRCKAPQSFSVAMVCLPALEVGAPGGKPRFIVMRSNFNLLMLRTAKSLQMLGLQSNSTRCMSIRKPGSTAKLLLYFESLMYNAFRITLLNGQKTNFFRAQIRVTAKKWAFPPQDFYPPWRGRRDDPPSSRFKAVIHQGSRHRPTQIVALIVFVEREDDQTEAAALSRARFSASSRASLSVFCRPTISR